MLINIFGWVERGVSSSMVPATTHLMMIGIVNNYIIDFALVMRFPEIIVVVRTLRGT